MRRVAAAAGTTGARPYAARPATLPLGPAGGYTPGDIATAYGANPAVGGSGQTVALVDAFNDPNINADLATFDARYGLPAETAASFRVVGQDGTTTLPAQNDPSGWSAEEALDVETVRGLCHLCNVVLVEANSDSDTDLSAAAAAAAALGATVIGNSYGFFEGLNLPDEAYDFPGVVVVAATGDDGWYDQDLLTADNSPSVPASAPDVVAVGGTTLNVDQNGARRSETTWNDDGPYDYNAFQANAPQGATGGGCSTVYTAQPWQLHAAGYAATGCGSARSAADVSVDGDYLTGLDVYSSYDCGAPCEPVGWGTFGGTSLSSAIVAALWALAGGSHGLQYPAASLYAARATPAFHDVTEGGSGYCDGFGNCQAQSPSPNTFGNGLLDCAWDASGVPRSTVGQCNAGPGYDGPTGVGTPNGLAGFIAAHPAAAVTVPAKVRAKSSARFRGSKSRDPYPGEHLTSYTWSWGDGSARSTGATASHTYRKAGTYHLRLTVADSLGLLGHKTVTVRVRKH